MTPGGYYEIRSGRLPAAAWIINYDVERALRNYHFMAAQISATGRLPRIFASRDCPAIVVTNATLERVREPHVMAWRNSFFELQRVDFLMRVEECLAGRRRYLGAELEADRIPA